MMKVALALVVLGVSIGLTSKVFAQNQLPAQPSYATQSTGIGTTSKSASGAAPAATPEQENNTAEEDDTLYRGKTSEMENTLMRDDGMLHFKTRPKEKTQQVDSLKNLQSSGTDPKFQSTFATSGTSSIDKVAVKPARHLELPAENGTEPTETPSDSRFVKRHMTFSPPPEDKSKKAEADSSPSPTPSPSASPGAKKSNNSEK